MLVTGAGGFVGSAIVRRLVRPGTKLWDGSPVDRVIALLRPGGSAERLEAAGEAERWRIERADAHDPRQLGDVVRRVRPRAVVNAVLDPAVYTSDAVGHAPLEALFAELADVDGERIVHAGSAWVLAPGLRLDEHAALDPRSPYARHKAAEDELLPVLGTRTGVDWIDLRLFNVFGRYEKPSRLLPYLVAQLSRGEHAEVSHGAQVRDFNDVDDVADAFALALGASESACGSLLHVGSGRATTVRELASMVAATAGDASLIRFGAGRTADDDLPALVAEPARVRRVLGWKPQGSLEERVRTAAEWWLMRLPRSAAGEHRQEECFG